MNNSRKSLTPVEVLRNCRGNAISIELTNGDTVNGIVMRTDRAMNIVLKQCIRTGRDGSSFWKARECLVRGTSVRNIRMDSSALRVTGPAASSAAGVDGDRKKDRGKGAGVGSARNRVGAGMHKANNERPNKGVAKGVHGNYSDYSKQHVNSSAAAASLAHNTSKRARHED